MPAATETPLLPPIRHRRKGELTAERILDAGEALFAERGYAGTTLRDVAGRVGLRIPSLYNHFPNKESLYAAVLERGISPVLEALAEFANEGEGTRPDSPEFVERMLELLARRPNLPRLIQHEPLTGAEHLAPVLGGWLERAFAAAQETIEANPAARRWDRDEIPLLVLALYHVVVGYFTIAPLYKAVTREDLLSEQALAKHIRFFSTFIATLFAERRANGDR